MRSCDWRLPIRFDSQELICSRDGPRQVTIYRQRDEVEELAFCKPHAGMVVEG